MKADLITSIFVSAITLHNLKDKKSSASIELLGVTDRSKSDSR
jgi:hypothetical protein